MRRELPRLMFAAPRSGSGKTLITCGFLEILKRKGKAPRALKCGPDYIDPMFHRYVLGIPGGNLDSFFLDGEGLREQLIRAGTEGGGDEAERIAVLEGVMGYYDGLGGISSEASSYEVACLTETPVVLVLDCKGASLSLAAEAKGFAGLRRDSRICGVILNRLSPMLYERLGAVFERESGLRVLGYLPESEEYRLESRHLGLFLPEEIGNLRQTIGKLADQMEKTVNISALISLAGEAPALEVAGEAPVYALAGEAPVLELAVEAPALALAGEASALDLTETLEKRDVMDESAAGRPLRIGVARDEAFCFYYQENLRLMREMGAEPVYFSPLHDRKLPDGLSGLLLGGGYPENYAKELSDNRTMRESVYSAVSEGLPLLAECGGFLYLHESLEGSDGSSYPMAGVIGARAFRTGKLGRFGYITLTAPDGTQIRGHEFHYWESTAPGECWLAEKPAGGRSWRCMHDRAGQIAGFPHLYYPSNPSFLCEWLRKCADRRGIEMKHPNIARLKGVQPARLEPEDYRSWAEPELELELSRLLSRIEPPSKAAAAQAGGRWSQVAKPLGSLGVLEQDVTEIAGINGSAAIQLDKKALVIFCADNGVVEEGVTQTGQEVTAVVTANFTKGESCACLMAERSGTVVFPVDIGVACELGETGSLYPLIDRKVRRGTRNFVKEPAMTRRETLAAVLTGVDLVRVLREQGYQIIATGEMGIGNTTTSSAVASVLLAADPAEVTGKGAGLSEEGLKRKVETIRKGVALHRPNPDDGLDVLSKVGGLDLAGLAGVFLGGAVYRIPIVIDGFISAAAAAVAAAIDPRASGCMLAAHVSSEPAGRRMLDYLGKRAPIQAGMCLGEGTGAVALFPLLDMALSVYERMSTFTEIEIEEYQPL